MTKLQRVLETHRPTLAPAPVWSGQDTTLAVTQVASLIPSHASGTLPTVRRRHNDRDRLPPVFPMLGRLGPRHEAPRQLPELPEQRRVPVTLDFSRPEARLPFGMRRYVTAATLREMAGGRPFEKLLKKVGSVWEFVTDDTVIDLLIATQLFRLGRFVIFS